MLFRSGWLSGAGGDGGGGYGRDGGRSGLDLGGVSDSWMDTVLSGAVGKWGMVNDTRGNTSIFFAFLAFLASLHCVEKGILRLHFFSVSVMAVKVVFRVREESHG